MAKKSETRDLIFTFKYAKVEVDVDPDVYSDEDLVLIQQQVDMLSKEINVDKTYVDYKGTKYEKTFMYEDGWKQLCKLAEKTKYGKNATKAQNEKLADSYRAMIIQYVFLALEDLGYDTSAICLRIVPKTSFMVEIYADNIKHDNYPGKWQTW